MTTDEQIDEIMDWFDFAKVAKAMHYLNWTWSGEEAPEEPVLRKTARELLKEAVRLKHGLGTGGFWVRYDGDVLQLQFVVANWESIPE